MKHIKKLAAAATIVGVAGLTTVAWAAWTANGTGTGAAQAKTAAAVTLANATTTAQLYPGANGNVVVDITNPNPYAVVVSDVYHGAIGSITSGVSACDAANGLSFLGTWDSGSPKALAANQIIAPSTTYTLTIVNGLSMSNASDNACSGATFTVPVSVHAASVTSGTPLTSGSVTP